MDPRNRGASFPISTLDRQQVTPYYQPLVGPVSLYDEEDNNSDQRKVVEPQDAYLAQYLRSRGSATAGKVLGPKNTVEGQLQPLGTATAKHDVTLFGTSGL